MLPCIVIIASLHHISCGFVTIHLTIANSQDEVCDEAEAIYYTFGPGKALKMGDSGDIKIATAGKYYIFFNDITNEYAFIAVAE